MPTIPSTSGLTCPEYRLFPTFPSISLHPWRWFDLPIIIALLASMWLAAQWLYALPRETSLAIDAPPLLLPHDNLYGVEHFSDRPGSFRWTKKGAGFVQIPNPGGAPRVRMLLASGFRQQVELDLLSEPGAVISSFIVSTEPRYYTVLLPPANTDRLSLWLYSSRTRDPRNNRSLGIVVGEIATAGGGSVPIQVVGSVALAMLALYGALRQARLPLWAVAGSTVATETGVLLWHSMDGWSYLVATPALLVGTLVFTIIWLAATIERPAEQLAVGALCLAILALTLPMMIAQVCASLDYKTHLQVANIMVAGGTPTYYPHFVFQMIVLAIKTINPETIIHLSLFTIHGATSQLFGSCDLYPDPTGLEFPMVVSMVLLHIILGVVVYRFLRHAFSRHPALPAPSILALITLLLLLVAPVTLFQWISNDPFRYVSYIGINVYHNPTITVLKPLALLLFWFSLHSFAERDTPLSAPTGMLLIATTALLTILSTIAKPSYIICLGPGLVLLAAYRIVRKQPVNLRALAYGVLLPAFVVLLWQYRLTYAATTDLPETKIVFAPFEVMLRFASMPVLLAKFLLSILFPLCVLALFFRDAIKCVSLNLAWLVFGVGAAYGYLLAETGIRKATGNFLWGTQTSLFILFVVSVAFLVTRAGGMSPFLRAAWSDWRRLACLLAFGLHVASGILYYVAIITTLNWA